LGGRDGSEGRTKKMWKVHIKKNNRKLAYVASDQEGIEQNVLWIIAWH